MIDTRHGSFQAKFGERGGSDDKPQQFCWQRWNGHGEVRWLCTTHNLPSVMNQKLPLETWTQILEQAARVCVKSPLQHDSHSWPPCPVVPRSADVNANLTTDSHLLWSAINFAKSSARWYTRSSISIVCPWHGASLRSFVTFSQQMEARLIMVHVWTKYLIFQFNDSSIRLKFHIPILLILRHCAGIVGLGWDVRNGRFHAQFPSTGDMIECVPRGLQFFSFGNTRMFPGPGYLPLEVLNLNADSVRAIKLDRVFFFSDNFKAMTPLRNVTHLTMSSSFEVGDSLPRLLPSLTHLEISEPGDGHGCLEFYQHFKDTLVSLHLAFVKYHDKRALIFGVLPKLETFCFQSRGIGLDVSSSSFRSPRLKEISIRVYDYGVSRLVEQIFLELGNYIKGFRGDLLPALASITVSYDYPGLVESHTKEDINRACQTFAESLSSPNLRVTIYFP